MPDFVPGVDYKEPFRARKFFWLVLFVLFFLLLLICWPASGFNISSCFHRTSFYSSFLRISSRLESLPNLPFKKKISLDLKFDNQKGSQVFSGKLAGNLGLNEQGAFFLDLEIKEARINLPWIDGHGQAQAKLVREGTIWQIKSFSLKLSKTDFFWGPNVQLKDLSGRLSGSGSFSNQGTLIALKDLQLALGSSIKGQGSLSLGQDKGLQGTLLVTVDRYLFKDKLIKGLIETPKFLPKNKLTLQFDLDCPMPFLKDEQTDQVARISCGFKKPAGFYSQDKKLLIDFPQWLAEFQVINKENWSIKGDLIFLGKIKTDWLALKEPRISFRAYWDTGNFIIKELDCRLPNTEVSLKGQTLDLNSIKVITTKSYLKNGLFEIPELIFQIQDLGKIEASARFDLKEGIRKSELRSSDIKIEKILSVLEKIKGWPLSDWSSSGRISIQGNLKQETDFSKWEISLDASELSLSSPDNKIITQKIAGQVQLFSPKRNKDIKLMIQFPQGEALLETVYLNLEKFPIQISGHLLPMGKKEIKDIDLALQWTGFGQLTTQGQASYDIRGFKYNLDIHYLNQDIGQLLNKFIFKENLRTKTKNKGHLEFNGQISDHQDQTKVQGRLFLSLPDLSLTQTELSIQGMQINLPVQYYLGRKDKKLETKTLISDQAWGQFIPGDITWQGHQLNISPVPITLLPNSLFLGDPVIISAKDMGIKLSLEDFQIEQPLSPQFQANGRLYLQPVSFNRLTNQDLPVSGRIGGKLPRFSLNRNLFQAEGYLEGSLGRGRLKIDHLEAERPFSRVRKWGCDLKVQKLNLKKFSTSFGFGKITGLMDIDIDHLRMSYGQPVSFKLKAQSVSAQGVPQRISLEAINAISIIGTGSSLSNLGIRLYASFFQEFPYKKIGFLCALKNDLFTIRGLIRENNKEYIVKRSLIGVNVINSNPNNLIVFSDMLKRIQRVISNKNKE